METLLQIAAQLGIDNTFFYLFGMMLVLYVLLSLVYLKPYQRLLDSRKEKTEGAKKEAQELSAKVDEKFAQYKARLKEANDLARQALRTNEEAAKKEEAKILGEAANRVKTLLQSSQKELDAERKATLEAISGEINGIGAEIATKVLGRQVGAR